MLTNWWLLTLLALGNFQIIGGSLLAQGRVYEWHWEMHPMWWWGWGIGMMLMMLLFWGLVIAGLVLAVRWFLDQGRHARSTTALEILKQRYAKGEINKEEFEAKKRDLS
jgi:putative membrane protein